MTLLADTVDALRDVLATDPGPVVEEARRRWDGRVKPPGSLGRLEDVGTRLAAIAGTCPPPVPTRPVVLVYAGDHGVVADGASAWPSDITTFMVRTMVAGGAAINALATTVGATVTVVDVGVAGDLDDLDGLVRARVRPGTASLAHGPAMARSEAQAAVEVGIRTTLGALDGGADLVVPGEVGIGNTTPSAALVARFAGVADPATVVGPGAGLPEDAMATKRRIVVDAVARAADLDDPVDVVAEIGGLELAAMAGAYLAAASRRVPAVVDGVIAGAAACVAEALVPGTSRLLLAGHRSTEPAASAALAHLDAQPILDLDLRLGEGTGACLAVPLVQAACRALADMHAIPTG